MKKPCQTCGKLFNSVRSLDQHLAMVHGSGKAAKRREEQVARSRQRAEESEPSIASLLVEAHIARACGEPVDDWLLEMMD